MVRSIVIPGEVDWWGWSNFVFCLKRSIRLKEKVELERPRRKNNGEGKKGNSDEYTGCKMVRSWKYALVVSRNTIDTSWHDIKGRLKLKLGRTVAVAELTAGKSVIWCKDEEKMDSLWKKPMQLKAGKEVIKIERWNHYMHWEYLQIVARDSWIGLGLPINMWNIHTFRVIGEKCGGLIDIAEATKILTFIKYAMIKVWGFPWGIMDPIMEILCQGIKISLGLFSIRSPSYVHKGGGGTAGIINRSVKDFTGVGKDGVGYPPSMDAGAGEAFPSLILIHTTSGTTMGISHVSNTGVSGDPSSSFFDTHDHHVANINLFSILQHMPEESELVGEVVGVHVSAQQPKHAGVEEVVEVHVPT